VALSAAVLLSFVAALVVSRPLRRITDGARAFAAGDFGHPVAVDSKDELGDAARALVELAGQLRGRLLSSGADRAALHALLDDLPVGVVLFDPHGAPVVISARAREVCDLTPHLELERARQLFEACPPDARRRVLEDGVTVESPLVLPWKPDVTFAGRWIPIFAPDGARQPALVVVDDAARRQAEVERSALVSSIGERLRGVARSNPAAAAELVVVAEALDALAERPMPRPGEVTMVPVGDLCRGVLDEVGPVGASEGALLEADVADEAAAVVEAGGRVRGAVRSLVLQALRGCGRGQTVHLRTEPNGRHVRIVIRSPRSIPRLRAVQATLQPLGGDAGGARDGDAFVHWADLPRS
jgi:HAMP domain-containing protein